MSGRRAIIHIGAPRTGTTTLQTVLRRHRSALLARGVLYPALTPASAACQHINHQHLGETLDGRRPRAAISWPRSSGRSRRAPATC